MSGEILQAGVNTVPRRAEPDLSSALHPGNSKAISSPPRNVKVSHVCRPPRTLDNPVSVALATRRPSSALWCLLRADGASGSSPRRVQCHGGANERLQRLCINLVALMEIDGTPGVACEAGVEEA